MNETTQSNRAVVVLGMHRSGTSVITRSLEACGVYLGNRLIPAGEDNEKGFFEDAEVIRLNEELLAELGSAWFSIFVATADESVISKYVEHILDVLKLRFSAAPLWGIKEPRITRLPMVWDRVFKQLDIDVKYILVNRHPFSVADSLKKRNAIPALHALVIWMIHQADGMSSLIKHGGIVVDYDLFIDNPERELQRISKHIGSQPKHADNFLSGFLERSLRHTTYNKLDEHYFNDETERLSIRFYSYMRHCAQNDIPLDSAVVSALRADLDEYLHQHNPLLKALDEITHAHVNLYTLHKPLSKEHELLVSENRKLRSEVQWLDARRFYNRLKFIKKLIEKLH